MIRIFTKNTIRRSLSLLISMAILISTVFAAFGGSLAVTASDSGKGSGGKSFGSKLELGDPDEIVRVSIVLDGDSLLDAGYSSVDIADNVAAMRYRDKLIQKQEKLVGKIEKKVLDGQELDVVWNLTVAANLISANVRRGCISDIEALPGVAQVVQERQYYPDSVTLGDSKNPNMAIAGGMNHTDTAWNAGYTGAGTRIAIIDTGLDTDHQSFDAKAYLASIAEWEESTGKKASTMDKQDVLDVLDKLNIFDRGVSAEQIDEIFKNEKVPFGYNYVDYSFDITHDNDDQGEHGSHVAGIAAANRLVDTDKDGKYEDALETVSVAGNAPDAQILVMKVFGRSGGAYDSDCVAAIEDAIWLKADSVNLSLGGAYPGMAIPNYFYDNLMKSLTDSDTVVVISSGNSGAWADGSAANGGNLYADGINFQTGGEPGSYGNAFTVASVENQGVISQKFTVDGKSYRYTEDTSYGNPHLTTLDKTGEGTEYPFFILPEGSVSETTKPGTEEEFFEALGDKAKGAIVVCWRGGTNADGEKTTMLYKVQQAEAHGAVGVMIVNYENRNIIVDLTGYEGKIPVVTVQNSVGKAMVQYCLDNGEPEIGTKQGKLTVHSQTEVFDRTDSNTFNMSDYSGWGVPGDLSLKPEITAPGGNIYSVNGLSPDGSSYESMSGTSMAAPQISGMAALVQQYLREQGIKADGMTARALTHSLMMATAHPMKDSQGRFYPVFQQGAGLADVAGAISSPVYITVKGTEDGKVKAELGDDITKSGVYEITFTLHNLTGVTQYYNLSANTFTQLIVGDSLTKQTRAMDATVEFLIGGKKLGDDSLLRYDFNNDGALNRQDAQLLLDHVISGVEIAYCKDGMDVDGDGDVDTRDVHTLLTLDSTCAEVPANGEVEIKATITLSAEEKKLLNEVHTKGAYVEAYLTASPLASDDGAVPPELNVPVLGFYGNWTDSSMYDVGSMLEHDYGFGDTRTPYLGNYNFEGDEQTWLTAKYNYFDVSFAYEDFEFLNPYYGNPQGLDQNEDLAYQYYPERNAISGNIRLENYYYALIRNAGAGVIQVTNEAGDEVYFRTELEAQEGAYYIAGEDGGWFNTLSRAVIDWSLDDYTGDQIQEGDKIKLSLIMAPEYYADEEGNYNWDALTDGKTENGELGSGAYLSTTFTVDLTPPEFLYPEEIMWGEDYGDCVFLPAVVTDNQYVSYLIPRFYDDEDGVWADPIGPWGFWSEYYEQNQTAPDQELDVEIYLFMDYLNPEDQDNMNYDGVYNLLLMDYAGNTTIYRYYHNVEPTYEPESVEIYQPVTTAYGDTYHDQIHEVSLLPGSSVTVKGVSYPITLTDRSVRWESDDPDIASVDQNGKIVGNAVGQTKIHAISNLDGSVEATVDVTVYIIPGVATGILSDENYVPRLFDWDFGAREITMGSPLSINPVAATQKYDSDHFYMLDVTSMLYEMDAQGNQLGKWNWKGNGPGVLWDITDSAVGLFAVNAGNLFGPYEPDGFQSFAWPYGEALGMPNLWFLTIAAADEPWEALVNDGTEEGMYLTGDVCLYSIDSDGYVWKFYIYWDEEQQMYAQLYEMYESDLMGLGAYPEGGEPYCSMVVGDDGNLYFSFKGYDRSYLYQLRYDEDEEYYRALPLDQTPENVWPADLFSVTTGAPAEGEGEGDDVTHALHPSAITAEKAVNITEMPDKTPSGTAVGRKAEQMKAGSFNVANPNRVTSPADEVLVDQNAKTLTVPIYANGSENGNFALKYDPEVLTFKELQKTAAVLTSVEEKMDEGAIHAGYADAAPVNGWLMTAVFTYEPKINEDVVTAVTVETYEDGGESGKNGEPLKTESTEVTLTGITVEHKLTVRYVDENGKEIAAPQEQILKEGSPYEITPPDIKNFKFDHADGNLSGTLDSDVEIVLVYKVDEVVPPPTGDSGAAIALIVLSAGLLCLGGVLLRRRKVQ